MIGLRALAPVLDPRDRFCTSTHRPVGLSLASAFESTRAQVEASTAQFPCGLEFSPWWFVIENRLFQDLRLILFLSFFFSGTTQA